MPLKALLCCHSQEDMRSPAPALTRLHVHLPWEQGPNVTVYGQAGQETSPTPAANCGAWIRGFWEHCRSSSATEIQVHLKKEAFSAESLLLPLLYETPAVFLLKSHPSPGFRGMQSGFVLQYQNQLLTKIAFTLPRSTNHFRRQAEKRISQLTLESTNVDTNMNLNFLTVAHCVALEGLTDMPLSRQDPV